MSYPPPPAPYPIQPEKSWFARHLVLSILLAVALAGMAFIAALFFGIMTLLKSSDVYREAVAKAQRSPAVAEALGQPVQAGWWMSGSINVSGPSGNADIAFPISGPKAKGTVFAVATKRAGTWHFKLLEVAVEGQPRRIPLVVAEAGSEPAVPEQ